ncbi:hypothetical protein RI129_003670 [Pyrocoelia pectoralis]|uniref:Peroxisomal membrane protein 11B n=1 Tax=Pyrocoelia pectoralis TaxID=417401 RepID=A0AAN7VSL4_9COLE
MESLIKLNNQTAGRDKIARLAQYLSRLLWYRFEYYQKGGVHNLKALEYQLSTFRKLLRFGRCIDSLYTVIHSWQHPNLSLRLSITLSKIYNALFLFADHILWLGRSDLYNINTDKWSNISNKYWLYSIIMNLVRDFYEILVILKANKSRILPKSGVKNFNDILSCSAKAVVCINGYQNVVVDTVRNCCDVFIPLTALGHTKLSPGTIGLLGVISSIAGIISLIEPAVKLA